MDVISIIGLVVGLAAILGGQWLEGGHLSSLVQPTAFVIVMGGTFGAVMLQSPFATFMQGMAMARWVFAPPVLGQRELIDRIMEWSHTARREGLLALEGYLAELNDPFLRKGLQLLVDGAEPDRVREVLEVEIAAQEDQMKLAAKVWESAGGYAPTIGILGAVMGLIHVMENLSDPSKLGAGIAVAFVATIYGVGSANLIFLPIAKKLLAHVARLTLVRDMYVDGLIGVASGDNPRIIESRLQGYLV
ncbi:MAG: flagellar motor protein [Rhodocyclales bacterium]|jgi:chemotaxis protein MotA|nr:MAG: flagellar motor protein [Rhodocyclales bacterium]